MGPFLETLIGGLMTGMLYSLVALGFVLIFKASGVFNFAQGAMVLFAALTMARFAQWIPQVDGPVGQAAGQPAGLRRGDGRDDRRGLADRAPGAGQAGQPGRHHAADGHAGHHLLPRRLRPDAVRQRHLQDRRRPAEGPDLPVRADLPGRRAGQPGRPRRRGDCRARWSRCWRPSSSTPAPAARCARWPTTTRPRSRSASR